MSVNLKISVVCGVVVGVLNQILDVSSAAVSHPRGKGRSVELENVVTSFPDGPNVACEAGSAVTVCMLDTAV